MNIDPRPIFQVSFDGDPGPTFHDQILARFPWAYYRLDVTGALVNGNLYAADQSGNGNSARIRGTGWTYGVPGALTPGDMNTALGFNASCLDLQTALTAPQLATYALMGWVQLPSNPGSNGIIVGSDVVQMYVKTTGVVEARQWDGSAWRTITGSHVVTDGAWHHVCVVWDAATLFLYVDGVLDVKTVFGLGAAPAAAAHGVGIGGSWDGATVQMPLTANIDEAGVYLNTILHDHEVALQYESRLVQ